MKHTLTLAFVLGAAAAAPFALAGPAPDIPSGHWAAGAIRRLTAEKILVGGPGVKFQGDKPVTRYELAVTLDRLVHYMEAGRKPLSAGKKQGAAALPAGANAAAKHALAHLAQGGFISANSPLLQADKAVTARELTDVLAQVTIRLSDRSLPVTHP